MRFNGISREFPNVEVDFNVLSNETREEIKSLKQGDPVAICGIFCGGSLTSEINTANLNLSRAFLRRGLLPDYAGTMARTIAKEFKDNSKTTYEDIPAILARNSKFGTSARNTMKWLSQDLENASLFISAVASAIKGNEVKTYETEKRKVVILPSPQKECYQVLRLVTGTDGEHVASWKHVLKREVLDLIYSEIVREETPYMTWRENALKLFAPWAVDMAKDAVDFLKSEYVETGENWPYEVIL